MHPHELSLFGLSLAIWNAMLIAAVVVASAVFARSASGEPALDLWPLRYAVFVYLSALAAQVFAYALDASTSMTPPPGSSLAWWYLNPLAGPKTLYGVIVLAPVSVAVATVGCRISTGRALDLWTPAILVVLAMVRVGCLLEGCCYGVPTTWLGITFPAGSPAFWNQVGAGLIDKTAAAPLPVVATQPLEAAFLAVLALWAMIRERKGRSRGIFAATVAAYSVFRFVIEFVRADEGRGIYGPLATSQWIALVVLAVLAALALLERRRAVGAEVVAAEAAPGEARPA